MKIQIYKSRIDQDDKQIWDIAETVVDKFGELCDNKQNCLDWTVSFKIRPDLIEIEYSVYTETNKYNMDRWADKAMFLCLPEDWADYCFMQ